MLKRRFALTVAFFDIGDPHDSSRVTAGVDWTRESSTMLQDGGTVNGVLTVVVAVATKRAGLQRRCAR